MELTEEQKQFAEELHQAGYISDVAYRALMNDGQPPAPAQVDEMPADEEFYSGDGPIVWKPTDENSTQTEE